MDQFSTQLAMDIENGYVDGIPEVLIQVYNDLSGWCELIQCKIDEDIISKHNNIRKKVLSHNLLIHVQDLWKQKVNEFYTIEEDEESNGLVVVFRDGIDNCQNIEGEIKEEEEIEKNQNYDNDCGVPASSEEEYFNNNDSLPSEKCYQNCENDDNISSEVIIIPTILNVDVYECNNNNGNECNNNLGYYKKTNFDSTENDIIYPTITSFPELPESYENDSSTNDFLNTSIYNSDYEIYCTMDDNEKEKLNIDQIIVNLNSINNYEYIPDLENHTENQLYESTDDLVVNNIGENEK